MLTKEIFFLFRHRSVVVMDATSQGNAVVVVFEWGDYKYVGKNDAAGEVSRLTPLRSIATSLCILSAS